MRTAELSTATFTWMKGFYHPVRHRSGLGYRSRDDFQGLHVATRAAA